MRVSKGVFADDPSPLTAGPASRVGAVGLVQLTLLALAPVQAQDEIHLAPPRQDEAPQTIRLPYAFFNDSFGAALGYVYSVVGAPQPQSALLASAMGGTNGSVMGFFMARDLRVFGVERLFMDGVFSGGYFVDNAAYIDGNPVFPAERAGSNDSDPDDFVEGDGADVYARVKFKYLLPIGHGRDHVVPRYRFDRGLLVDGSTGGGAWNPLESGRTYVELRPFYRSLSVDSDVVDEDLKTNGLDLSLFWDNRDYPANPSRGNSVRARLSRDFGSMDSSTSWTVYEAEIDQYFSFGGSDWFRERVLALDVWTSYSPTWEEEAGGSISNGPPAYAGATLGGLFRMRGFPSQRFSDKAALLYSAELRLTPKWNPFTDWDYLQEKLDVQWLQFAAFTEVGRVSPSWDLETLHEDMQVDGGIGLRLLAKGLVLRLDFAASDEGSRVQMMVGNPFQF